MGAPMPQAPARDGGLRRVCGGRRRSNGNPMPGRRTPRPDAAGGAEAPEATAPQIPGHREDGAAAPRSIRATLAAHPGHATRMPGRQGGQGPAGHTAFPTEGRHLSH